MAVRSRSYAVYIVALLTAINFFNYVDRLAPQAMLDDLRAKFHFSDTQLGSFWFAFFLVHAFATFPFGWASDHYDRRKIMGAGIIVWSLATLGSAHAWDYFSMLLLRALIGIGEAAYGPPANVLLCEAYPGNKARVIAIFNAGMFAGACVGLAIGDWIGFPHAFHVVAIPGLVLGGLVWVLDVPPERTLQGPRPKMATMLRDGWRALNKPSLRWLLASGILISFAAGGYISWIVDFTVHHKMVHWNMTKTQVVNVYFIITLVAGVLGVLAAGFIADHLMHRTRAGRALTVAIGFACAVPFAIAVVFLNDRVPFFICGAMLLFFLPWYNGPMPAVIDDVVDDSEAGTAQASFIFFLHVVGTGPAGLVLGAISDVWNLRYAFLLPALAVAASALCAFMGARHVPADMRAKAARAAIG